VRTEDHLTDEQRATLRRILQERLHELEAKLVAGAATLTETDASSELSRYDNHPADDGTLTHDRSRDLALALDYRAEREEILRALRRMEEGTYGLCERCGAPIPFERLLAVPAARFCLEHEREFEEARWRETPHRPAEEEYLRTWYGSEGDRRAAETPGISPEDVWEEVENFGTSDTSTGEFAARSASYSEKFPDAGNPVEEIPANLQGKPHSSSYFRR